MGLVVSRADASAASASKTAPPPMPNFGSPAAEEAIKELVSDPRFVPSLDPRARLAAADASRASLRDADARGLPAHPGVQYCPLFPRRSTARRGIRLVGP
jgi:hypothetical protein